MIITWSKGPADEGMPEAMLTETLGKVRRHPWWQARTKIALAVLRQHGIAPPAAVMDVGCGWGTNLEALEKNGYQTTGLDISRNILELIDHPARRLIEADLNQALPEKPELFDGLLALDVIEHLDDDRLVLTRAAKMLRPKGVIVVSVPALPELFSEFDHIQGHRRRYLPETLRAAFDGTGLGVTKIFWWGAWMVPVLESMRKKTGADLPSKSKTYSDYLRLPPWPGSHLMNLFFALEKSRALNGQLRRGTSLFAVAVRGD